MQPAAQPMQTTPVMQQQPALQQQVGAVQPMYASSTPQSAPVYVQQPEPSGGSQLLAQPPERVIEHQRLPASTATQVPATQAYAQQPAAGGVAGGMTVPQQQTQVPQSAAGGVAAGTTVPQQYYYPQKQPYQQQPQTAAPGTYQQGQPGGRRAGAGGMCGACCGSSGINPNEQPGQAPQPRSMTTVETTTHTVQTQPQYTGVPTREF